MDDLRRLATRTRRSAEEVYRFRGNIVPGLLKGGDRPLIVAWEEFKVRAGDVRLRLNRKHPLIQDALSGPVAQKRAVERVLKFVEETIPTSLIGIRLAESLDTQTTPYETRPDELMNLLRYALDMMTAAGMTRDKAIDELALLEPFSSFPAITESLRDGDA